MGLARNGLYLPGEGSAAAGLPAALGACPTLSVWTGHPTWLPSKTCPSMQSLASGKSHLLPAPGASWLPWDQEGKGAGSAGRAKDSLSRTGGLEEV